MTDMILDQMAAAIDRTQLCFPIGRVSHVAGNRVIIIGFPTGTALGDRIEIQGQDRALAGEIVRLENGAVEVLLDSNATGISIGSLAKNFGAPAFSPSSTWIGRVIDPDGRPLDGVPLLHGVAKTAVDGRVLAANERRPLGLRLETGLATFNTLLPLVKGQRIGLFAGSGVGKSTLLASLANGVEADVIVIALVGERGREVREFTQTTLGPEGMKRTIVVAATSDRPPHIRRRCAISATRVAEHFRDQGKHVLLLCDSITRFCEAHREVAVAAGEPASLRGFPASTAGSVAGLCERAGPGTHEIGDITAVYTVLVAGSDMEEPVADMLRGILDGHVVLDRAIAERGRFPAVDVLRSVSRSLPNAADAAENELIKKARQMLATYDRSEMMIKSGLYEAGSDAEIDMAVACFATLDSFQSLCDGRTAKAHFASLRQALQHGGAI